MILWLISNSLLMIKTIKSFWYVIAVLVVVVLLAVLTNPKLLEGRVFWGLGSDFDNSSRSSGIDIDAEDFSSLKIGGDARRAGSGSSGGAIDIDADDTSAISIGGSSDDSDRSGGAIDIDADETDAVPVGRGSDREKDSGR
ncbi:hypothetical protein JKY72_01340 [Candidatus Gracilibacteria bacterium]|nr:hypothetical protein [Candidatus Gracilibacteria bacterium]